jgi:hypothetical protein
VTALHVVASNPGARGHDDLGTPTWLVEIVRGLGPIDLDPCSNPWSLVEARVALSKHAGDDGLARPWSELVEPGALVFVNPPYSAPLPWCQRIVEAAGAGLEVVALVKLDPSTKWSALLRAHRNARCDLHRRIRFEGGEHAAGKLASSLSYFGTRPYLFAHLFDALGEVQVYR